MRKIVFLIFIAISAIGAGCDNKSGNAAKSTGANSLPASIKKGVTPVADPEIAVIEMETPAFGTIKLELYSNIAPKMVARFKELAKEGYYDGIAFHRINQSVIQAGDANTKPAAKPTGFGERDSGKQNVDSKAKPGAMPAAPGEGDSGKPNVDAEFSDLLYDAGTLGAARLTDVNSANSQFFITLKREQGFDNRYTIFGKVIEGMNNVMTISGVQPKNGEKPVEPVRIKHISIVQR